MNATIPQATTAPLICETDETGFVTRVKLDGFTYVPEPVRCRDCRHYVEHEWVIATDVSDVCHFWHQEPTKVEPNGFCKWGERKAVSK